MKTKLKSRILTLLILLFCCFSVKISAQEASVEKSVFGLETGFLGIWLNNEVRLMDQLSLRTEIGLNAGIFGRSSIKNQPGFILTPEITLEPRWYYNLKKRKANQKNISNNSGNYFALKTTYSPDWFAISNSENINPTSHFSIIPTWGIRRNIGKHFYFETAIGIGYRHYFGNDEVNLKLKDNVALNAHLRFGYRF